MNWVNNLGNMLLRVLRIPPGTSVRRANGSNKFDSAAQVVEANDMINAVVDITVNDVCIGASPLFFKEFKGQIRLKSKVKKFIEEANDIVRDVATDLLKRGHSVWEASSFEGNSEICLFPVIDDVQFFIDKKKKVHVFKGDDELKDVLVFLCWSKESLVKAQEANTEKKDDLYAVDPVPIQLKNLSQIGYDLVVTERSIAQYRKQLSKIVRLITFDAGISSGDDLDQITEQISSMINAESNSLMDLADPATDFDDAIPVLPNRRGVGKPEIIESIPSADIKALVDYDLLLKKLFLAMKFPQSYADFSTALGESAVSTIRGDIRYARMIDFAQTLITKTLNQYLWDNSMPLKGRDVVGITALPNPEDADIVANLTDFTSFAQAVSEFIFGAETYEEAKARLSMLKSLFQSTSSFKLIEEWEKSMSDVIKQKYGDGSEETPPEEPGGGGNDLGDLDLGDEITPEDIPGSEEQENDLE